MGEIYVSVAGYETHGIMPLDGSGGTEAGGYWILWTNTGGYTNQGWFWDQNTYPNNYLPTGWAKAVTDGSGYVDIGDGTSSQCSGGPHEATYDGFITHMEQCNPVNLNAVLGEWTNASKNLFINHDTNLYMSECIDWRS